MFETKIENQSGKEVVYERGDITIPVLCVTIDNEEDEVYCTSIHDVLAFLHTQLDENEWKKYREGKQVNVQITVQHVLPDDIEDMEIFDNP